MFVSAKIHAKALQDLAVERAKRESTDAALKILATQMNFLCIRVNQLEAERAVLLQATTKLHFPVPSLVTAPTRTEPVAYSDFFTDLSTEDAPESVS